MNDIDMPFTSLKDQINRLKVGIDKCFVPSIYDHTYKIARIMKSIESMNLAESQKKVLDKLDTEALKQFERLSKGRCSCSVSKDI